MPTEATMKPSSKMVFAISMTIIGCIALQSSAQADDLAHLMRQVAIASDHLVTSAERPGAKLSSIGQKALVLTTLLMSMNSIIEREPDEAADHIDILKSVGQDEMNLGEAEMTLSNMEDNDDNASIMIEHIKTIAEAVGNSARQYSGD